VFAICMGKQCKIAVNRCDFGRAKSLSTRGSGHMPKSRTSASTNTACHFGSSNGLQNTSHKVRKTKRIAMHFFPARGFYG
jgi:hypothetical protein